MRKCSRAVEVGIMRRFDRILVALIVVSYVGAPGVLADGYPSYFGGISPEVVAFDPAQPIAAVMGRNGGFLVDFSDKEAPRMLYPGSDRSAPPPTTVHMRQPKVALEGSWLVVSSKRSSTIRSVILYDVSDPVGEWPATLMPRTYGSPGAVDITGGVASVAYWKPDGSGAVFALYQLGGDDHLQELGSVAVAGTNAIVRFGSLAAVAGDTGIDLVDLSDPSMPVIVDHVDEGAVDLAVAGNVLVTLQKTSVSEKRLMIFDISDPASVVFRGATGAILDAGSISAAGGFAYIGRAWYPGMGETLVVSLSDPAVPSIVATLGTGATWDMDLRDNVLLTAGGEHGARFGRLADATTLAGSTERFSGRIYRGGEVAGGRLFLPVAEDGVWIVESRADHQLVELGLWERDGFEPWTPIAVGGDLLWALSGNSIFAVDISDVTNPVTIAELHAPASGVLDVTASGSVAAVLLSNPPAIAFIDARDPAQIVWAGQFNTGVTQNVEFMEMSGSALVWSRGDAVHVVDVTDPSAPVETASFLPEELDPSASDFSVYDLAAEDGRAWINLGIWYGYYGGLRGVLIDVSDPADATPLGPYQPVGDTINVSGSVYVSTYASYPPNGYTNVEMADLRNPGFGDSWGMGGSGFEYDALTDGRCAFGAGGAYGVLAVLDFSGSGLFMVFSGGFETGDLDDWSDTCCSGGNPDPPIDRVGSTQEREDEKKTVPTRCQG